MTQNLLNFPTRQFQIVSAPTPSVEAIAKFNREEEAFRQRCQAKFERVRVRSEYIDTHHSWYVAVEPESGYYSVNTNNKLIYQNR